MENKTKDNTISACFVSLPHFSEYHCIKNLRCWKLRHFLAKIHFSETTKYIFLWRMLCWLGMTSTLAQCHWDFLDDFNNLDAAYQCHKSKTCCLSHMIFFSILLRFICYSAYCTERSNSNTAQCFSCNFGDIMAHHFSNCIVDCWWWNYYQR